MQIGLACLKEYLNLPLLSVDPDDLFFGQFGICTDESNLVFLVFLIPNADDFDRNLLVFTNHGIHGKKILTAAAALLADAENLFDGKLLPFILVVNAGTLLEHSNGIQTEFFRSDQMCRTGEPLVKQDVVRMMTGVLRSLKQLDHDFCALCLCKLSTFCCKGTTIALVDRANKISLFSKRLIGSCLQEGMYSRQSIQVSSDGILCSISWKYGQTHGIRVPFVCSSYVQKGCRQQQTRLYGLPK